MKLAPLQILVRCVHPHCPTSRRLRALANIDNFGQAYGAPPGLETAMHMYKHIGMLSMALTLPLLAAAGPPEERAQAEPRLLERIEAAAPRAVITVDCEAARWPTLREVARHNGVSVFDPVEHVRHRIVIEGSRACRHGADRVVVVFTTADRAVAVARSER